MSRLRMTSIACAGLYSTYLAAGVRPAGHTDGGPAERHNRCRPACQRTWSGSCCGASSDDSSGWSAHVLHMLGCELCVPRSGTQWSMLMSTSVAVHACNLGAIWTSPGSFAPWTYHAGQSWQLTSVHIAVQEQVSSNLTQGL